MFLSFQLAQIPECYQPSPGDDCDRLCKESDALLRKAEAAEDAGDLGTAVALCNAANSKARAAMDAPYNNPKAMSNARLTHSTCVMIAKRLHKRMLQEQALANGEKEEVLPEGRHSRESSKSGQHSRQGSRDKGNHSRQNSRELLVNVPAAVESKPVTKSIEIYATLPKKKTLRSKATAVNVIEDEEYMLYDRPAQRTGLFGRTKRCDDDKKDKKRARSEERNKNVSKDFSIAPSRLSVSPKTVKSEKSSKDTTIDVSSKNAQNGSSGANDSKQGKKQHKIRRKLLMGGLIKRKNRSMPDLREGQDGQAPEQPAAVNNTLPKQSVDDSNVGLKGNDPSQSLSGYLSEGHLEFTGSNGNANSGNPNLERSRLMRKSFHGSVGKALHVAKVPPPPPLRTTSQLSKSKCAAGEVRDNEHQSDKSIYGMTDEQSSTRTSQEQTSSYWNHTSSANYASSSGPAGRNNNYADYSSEPHSLPFLPSYNVDQSVSQSSTPNSGQQSYSQKPRIQDDVVQYANGILYEPTFVVTRADVHSEQSPGKQQQQQQHQPPESLPPYPDNGNVSHSRQPSEEFPPPPYPSIPSVSHSRQPSEDFPPPPPEVASDNVQRQSQTTLQYQQMIGQQCQQYRPQQRQQQQQQLEAQQIGSLLAQLQLKREQILTSETTDERRNSQHQESIDDEKNSGETWLRELQAKQAERRMKKQGPLDGQDVPKVRSSSGSTIARRTSDLMMNSLGQAVETPAGRDVPDCARSVLSSVKDMAARFEQIKAQPAPKLETDTKTKFTTNCGSSSPALIDAQESQQKLQDELAQQSAVSTDVIDTFPKSDNQPMMISNYEPCSGQADPFAANNTVTTCPPPQNGGLNAAILSMSLTLPHENGLPVDYPEDDISEVAMQNTIQNTSILPNADDIAPRKTKRRIGKKKSVSFCDQVVLVATAEDDEKDSYIPNPILERVLRSAMNKPETAQVLREIRSLQEAELNRDASVTKFQQHTLPLKSEADSIPATPFQDQLRSVNPITPAVENTRPTFARQNSNESVGNVQDPKKMYSTYGNESRDAVKDTYSVSPTNQQTKIPVSYSPQLQQQIRYSQNGYAPYQQHPTAYPQTQTSHPRNQTIPISQTQKPASPYPTQIHNQYPQTGLQQQKTINNCSKNGYQTYYHLEQQHNHMNKQISSQQQQQQQSQQNNMNQRIPSHNASPITVQHGQQFVYPANQSPNPYQQYATQNQYPQSSYPGYPHQNGPQQQQNGPQQQQPQQQQVIRSNQPLPQYQPPPNPTASYQQQQQQQQQMAQNYQQQQQQRIENYQRPPQKIEQQNVLAPNQTYPNALQNGQIQSNMKYPNYQHQAVAKQTKQGQLQAPSKCMTTSGVIQTPSSMQKSVSGMPRMTPCHLCRKKQVVEPATYCTDCDFYMSRFRPKN